MNINEKAALSPLEIDEMGKRGPLREALNTALKLIRDGEKESELYYVAANTAFRLGDTYKAEQIIKLLLMADTEHINGWLLLGKIYHRRGDAARFSHCSQQAEAVFPAFAELNFQMIIKNDITRENAGDFKTELSSKNLDFETETFADICAKQGYFNKALKIYSDLNLSRHDNSDLARKIDDIKKKMEKHD